MLDQILPLRTLRSIYELLVYLRAAGRSSPPMPKSTLVHAFGCRGTELWILIQVCATFTRQQRGDPRGGGEPSSDLALRLLMSLETRRLPAPLHHLLLGRREIPRRAFDLGFSVRRQGLAFRIPGSIKTFGDLYTV